MCTALTQVQSRFVVSIPELPDEIDASTYSKSLSVADCCRVRMVRPPESVLTDVQCNERHRVGRRGCSLLLSFLIFRLTLLHAEPLYVIELL